MPSPALLYRTLRVHYWLDRRTPIHRQHRRGIVSAPLATQQKVPAEEIKRKQNQQTNDLNGLGTRTQALTYANYYSSYCGSF